MSLPLVVVLLLSSCQLVRVASYRLTMSPDRVRISEDSQSASFTCTADVALTGCQFRWWNYDGNAGPLLELSRGSLTLANSTHLNTAVTGYSYSGRGMGMGDCGVSLQLKGSKRWMVACRVRAESGGWSYAWADMFADVWDPLPHTLAPWESVVLPGGEARFTLKAQEPLSRCRFSLPGFSLNFDQAAKSHNSTKRHRYTGGSGQCGLALASVSEADNGPVMGYIRNTAWTKDERRFMVLIVARRPSAPTLSVIYTDAGVTATCVVHEGRPVARISWVLGDDIVRQDSLDDSPGNSQDEWRWPWMQGSVLQRLTLRLRAKDNGTVLKCAVSHVTLARPLEASKIISFTGPASETSPLATVSTIPRTTSPCTKDELYDLRVREASAAAKTAELAEAQAKITLEAAKAEEASKAMLAKVALDAAKSSAKTEEESKAMWAKVALEAAKSSARAEEARAREEEAWAKNAEEELRFERERRSQGLQQPQSPQSVQG